MVNLPPGGLPPSGIPPSRVPPDSQEPTDISKKKTSEEGQPETQKQPLSPENLADAKLVKQTIVSPKEKSSVEKMVEKAGDKLRDIIGKAKEIDPEKTLFASSLIIKAGSDLSTYVGDGVDIIHALEGKSPDSGPIVEGLDNISDKFDSLEKIATTSLFLFYAYKTGERLSDSVKLNNLDSEYSKLNELIKKRETQLENLDLNSPEYQQLNAGVETLKAKVEVIQSKIDHINEKLGESKEVHGNLIKYSLKEGTIIASFAGKQIAAKTLGAAVKLWSIKLKTKGIKKDIVKRNEIEKELGRINEMLVNDTYTGATKDLLLLKINSDKTLYNDTCVSTLIKSVQIGGYSTGLLSGIATIGFVVVKSSAVILTGTALAVTSALAWVVSGVLSSLALVAGTSYLIYKNRHNIQQKGDKIQLKIQSTITHIKQSNTEKKLAKIENLKTLASEQIDKIRNAQSNWSELNVSQPLSERNITVHSKKNTKSEIQSTSTKSKTFKSFKAQINKLNNEEIEIRNEIKKLRSNIISEPRAINNKINYCENKLRSISVEKSEIQTKIKGIQKVISKDFSKTEKNLTQIQKTIDKMHNQLEKLTSSQEQLQSKINENKESGKLIKVAKALNVSTRKAGLQLKNIEIQMNENESDSINMRRLLQSEGVKIMDLHWGDPEKRRELIVSFLIPKK